MSNKNTRSGANAGNSGNDGLDAGTAAVLKRLDAMEKTSNEKANELKSMLDDKFNEFRAELQADFRDEFMPLIRSNETNILVNTQRIDDVETRIQYLEDRLEMNEKAADLIVRGVPVVAREVVANYYCAIARVLGFDADRIPPADVFRFGRKLPNSKQEPPILIKFSSKLDKSRFFKEYLSKTNFMKLTILGINVPTRFYISENLTKRSQSIFTEALRLKKIGKIDGVISSFGSVYVKPKNSQRSIAVRDLSSLRIYDNNE
jgi:hypothetical protein